jgi:hypothetical protein
LAAGRILALDVTFARRAMSGARPRVTVLDGRDTQWLTCGFIKSRKG